MSVLVVGKIKGKRRRRNLDRILDSSGYDYSSSKTPSCANVNYDMACIEIVAEQVSSKKLEDLKFPDMNIQDGMEPTMKSIAIQNYLMDLNGYSETAASYMCCKISEASYSDFEELSMKYEKWCDVNFAHFEKTQEILDLAKQYYQKMDYFHTVSTFCPRRITTKHKVKLTDNQIEATPWSKIAAATNLNAKVKDMTILNGVCKKVTHAPEKTGMLTIILADEDVFYASLKAFRGPEVTEENFYIWGPDANENLYSLEIVRKVHGTQIPIYGFSIGRAIRFTNIDEDIVNAAWEEWLKTDIYSLVDRSCVHSVMNLLKVGLPSNTCPFNHELQFPFPQPVFDQIVQIGKNTTLGTELKRRDIDLIQKKVDELAKKNKKARDDECTNSQPEGKGEEGKSEKEGEFANGDQSIVNSLPNSNVVWNMVIGGLLGVTIYHIIISLKSKKKGDTEPLLN